MWLVPSDAKDPCTMVTNASNHKLKLMHGAANNATLIIAASHHATVDPITEDTVVEGRNKFQIPAGAGGFKLLFVCSINGHCSTGQQLGVNVGASPSPPDPKLTDPDGICETGYTLCPDQSKQTATTASVATNVNVPWMDYLAGDLLRLKGVPTRASTPWADWAYRRYNGKRCRWRKQNTRVSHRAHGTAAGVDHDNQAAWEFPNNNIRDVVEASTTWFDLDHSPTCFAWS